MKPLPAEKTHHLLASVIFGALFLFIGCATVTIESMRDPEYTGKINRLFVIIRGDAQLGKAYAQNLQTALTERLSARGLESLVRTTSQLDLDDSKYSSEIKSFSPDAVLYIQRSGSTRHLQQIIEIYWDASLHSRQKKERVWRATIHTSGGSKPSKMIKLTDTILNQLEQDGIIPPAGPATQPQGQAAQPAGTDKPDATEGK